MSHVPVFLFPFVRFWPLLSAIDTTFLLRPTTRALQDAGPISQVPRLVSLTRKTHGAINPLNWTVTGLRLSHRSSPDYCHRRGNLFFEVFATQFTTSHRADALDGPARAVDLEIV
jgi:hypothetical protein